MSILIDEKTPIIIQGITGDKGTFHAKEMMEYGSNVVGGVTPGKGGKTHLGVPVFNTVREAVEATGATTSITFVAPPFAADAIMEGADAGLALICSITDGIPAQDMMRVKRYLRRYPKDKRTMVVGPNCAGIISPGKSMLGIMPGHIYLKGNVGVISRSGTLGYEAAAQMKDEMRAQVGQLASRGIVPGLGTVFVGDDPLPKAFGEIVESVRHTPSLEPDRLRDMQIAVEKGDLPTARAINTSMLPLVNAMGRLGGVTMVKAALRILGLEVGDPRLPQVPANPAQIGDVAALPLLDGQTTAQLDGLLRLLDVLRQAAALHGQATPQEWSQRLDALLTAAFGEEPQTAADRRWLQQLRGREGARVRRAYRAAAERTGVPWQRRDFDPEDFSGGTPINQALSSATACLYGVVHAVVVALGCSPGLGFVHTGHVRSFVFDIADLYKAEIAIPTAFDIAAREPEDVAADTRRAVRDAIRSSNLLERAARDIRDLLTVDPGAPDELDPGLWDERAGVVPGGTSYVDPVEDVPW